MIDFKLKEIAIHLVSLRDCLGPLMERVMASSPEDRWEYFQFINANKKHSFYLL